MTEEEINTQARVQASFWCFTENTDARDFWGKLGDIYESHQTHISYVCGQLEQGTHVHFQGYVQLKRARDLSWLKANVSDTAHWEIQRGTNDEARQYCQKTDETVIPHTFIEFGTFRPGRGGRGARNDIAALRDAIIQHKTQREIIKNDSMVDTFAMYIKFHDRVRSLFPPPEREERVIVTLLVGVPGTGKTTKAKVDNPGIYKIPIHNGTYWFDGYDDHESILFDDFMGRGSKMSLDNTLRLFDTHIEQIPIKGGFVWYRPKKIVITSNYHPRHWYEWKDREPSWEALKRRFTQIYYFPEVGAEPEEQYNDEYLENREFWPQPNVEYFQ